MKKTVVLFLLTISILCLFCGCFTSSTSFFESDNHQVYKSHGVSTKLTDRTVTKDDVIFLISDLADFKRNRMAEELLKEKFSQYGIKCVLTTDKLTGNEEDFSSLLYSLINSTNHQYRMFITGQELYTYTHGGSISSLETEVYVYWKNDYERQTITMSVSTECKENKLLHYSETLEDCLDSLCDEIVKQYMKYCQ